MKAEVANIPAVQLLGQKRKLSIETTTTSSSSSLQLTSALLLSRMHRASSEPTLSVAAETPDRFVAQVFHKNGLDMEECQSKMQDEFVEPTDEMISAYTITILKAARASDVEQLRNLLHSGSSLNCCNRFGESLIHLACRRGNLAMLKFLVEEAQVTLMVRDDFGRTCFHDAFWTPEPQFEVVEFLLEYVPDLLCVKDVRGHAPLDYIRHEHQPIWMDFFRLHEKKIRPKMCVTNYE